MASSNALACITTVVGLLTPALAPPNANFPTQVRVDDAYNPKLVEREYLYFGHITGPHEPMAFRAGARLPREETLLAELHVEVAKPAAKTADTAARALVIGQVVEETIANDPLLGGTVVGLLGAWISHFQLTSFYMEDGQAASQIVYQITFQSKLG